MTNVVLHAGDNRATLKRLIAEGVRVHSVVTDPPYGLVSIQKRFGKEGSKAARTDKNDGSFARLSGGFMGKAWDGSGIERDPEFWKLVYDILLPGGYVFAFSGSRTGHWQACAMELAGFIMHPMHGWVFGSGFPKASNAERAIDARICNRPGRHFEVNLPSNPRPDDHVCDSCPEGDPWEGWAYGTQAQKPALEPIYLGQKPFSEKTGAANLLKHGVGAVNIDGCRVGGDGGRHPANLILDGSPDVAKMFPTENARFFHQFPRYACDVCNDTGEIYTPMAFIGDSPSLEGCQCGGPLHIGADALFYHGKAGKQDRAGSKHPTVKPIALMQYLIRHITPPGGIVLDPFAGSGTTAEAARREGFECILMEAEAEYLEFLRQRFALYDDDFDDILGPAAAPKEFADVLG